MNALRRTLSGAVLTGMLAAALVGCSADASDDAGTAPAPAGESAEATADTGEWPRTITHEAGETVLDSQPTTIVSTSVTITGSLLAIDAPVTASAATTVGDATDENGFFSQWGDTAVERGVEVLYPDLQIDLEAVMLAEPDLIVVSATGADSTAEQYAQLSEIAPTIVLDYSSKTWQDLAEELGEATGLEEQAQAAVEDFDSRVAEVADAITVPDGTTSIVSFNGAGQNGVAKPAGSHGTLLASLGFDVVGAPDDLDESEQARQDFSFVSLENLTTALQSETILLIAADDTRVDALLGTEVLANLPAVTTGQVHALGPDSFRIDYYSANHIVDVVESIYG